MKRLKKEKTGKPRLLRLGMAALLSVMLCGLLGIGVLCYYFAPRDSGMAVFEVPDFVDRADNDIGTVEGVEIVREWVYSDEIGRGTVISQTPHAKARRKVSPGELCSVTVYISLGEKSERIPYLSGIDLLSASAALRSIGARVKTVAIYGEGDDGIVIGTSPNADEAIRRGDTVTVYVSRARVKEPIEVPDFCGRELGDAVRLALSLGLFVREIEGDGAVISQSIPAGRKVRADSYISFQADGGVHERAWPPVIE